MKIRLLLLFLVLCWGTAALFCADLYENELVLDVLLHRGNSINLHSAKSVSIMEAGAPIQKELKGSFSIEIASPDAKNSYGILNRVEEYHPNPFLLFDTPPDAAMRTGFTWKEGKLKLQKELLYFEDISFDSYQEALEYCQQTGYKAANIQPISIAGTQVKIKSDKGQIFYFELPIHIYSEQDLAVNGNAALYNGEFLLKSVGKDLVLIHKVPMEEYIAGVIQNEIGSTAPMEALKTQAVAARSHAISMLLYNKHKNDGFDLCNSTHCQVYKGKHLLNDKIIRAVNETKDEVLVFEGKIASTTYHSSSGGKTESSVNVWKGSFYPYLSGVTVYPEAEAFDLRTEQGVRSWLSHDIPAVGMSSWERATLNWNRSIKREALAAKLELSNLRSMEVLRRGYSGRILSVSFDNGKIVEGEFRIRELFGGLPSSLFYNVGSYSINATGNTVYNLDRDISIKGRGSGHGVGMCQVSVLMLARQGLSYQQILNTFYPATGLTTNWMEP